MSIIRKFITEKKPFAVIQYREYLKGVKDFNARVYEAIWIRDGTHVTGKVLKEEDLSEFKQNQKLFTKVIRDNDGAVFEFQNFKMYHEHFFSLKKTTSK